MCWRYENIRDSYNLKDENDAVDYLIEVIKLNQKVDEEGDNESEFFEEESVFGLEGSPARNGEERES